MTADFDALRAGLLNLQEALLGRLSDEDQRQVTELIDANEFGVALEWMLDSLAESRSTLPGSALPLVEKLAREMEIYPTVLERLPPELIEQPPTRVGRTPKSD